MQIGLLVGIGAFAIMEPATAAMHRFVMHGPGWKLHLSHHETKASPRFELNDLYPLVFAGLTMMVMAIGFQGRGGDVAVPATVGITVYGACYGFVHEIYIHQRIRFPWRVAILDRLKDAHRIHHLWSEAPYGMLFPMVPARLRARERAMTGTYDPFAAGEGGVTLV
ncbi:MAG: hypothetical protein NVS3B12_00510 [Acidimicrobiales bacterium]